MLKDAFATWLPAWVMNRPKKGFEIPLKEWLSQEVEAWLNGPLFAEDYLKKQGLFCPKKIHSLQKQWNKPGFGDRMYIVWALIIFQHWW